MLRRLKLLGHVLNSAYCKLRVIYAVEQLKHLMLYADQNRQVENKVCAKGRGIAGDGCFLYYPCKAMECLLVLIAVYSCWSC